MIEGLQYEAVDYGVLKTLCKEINDDEALAKIMEEGGMKKFRAVGVKKEKMCDDFVAALSLFDKAGEDAINKLSDECIAMYEHTMFPENDESEVTAEKADKPEKKAEKKKADKPVKKKAEKKKADKPVKKKAEKKKPAGAGGLHNYTKSRYGHKQKAASGELDDLIWNDGKGNTYAAIMKEGGFKYGRVASHVNAIKKKGIDVVIDKKESADKTIWHVTCKQEKV